MAMIDTGVIPYEIDNDKLEELTKAAKEGWGAVDLKVKNENFNVMRIADTKIHNMVYKLTPPMTNEEFIDLIEDIAKHGQIEPVKIWKKAGTPFIVDGRNRRNALLALGIEYIKYVEVNITTLEDLRVRILSWDRKRKTTASQKAIVAYIDYKENHKLEKEGMDFYAEKYGVSKTYISFCKTIDEMKGGGQAILNEMFEYRIVEIGGKKLKSLSSIANMLKKLNKKPDDDRRIPDGYRNSGVGSGLREMRSNGDIQSLAYAREVIKRMINEINNEEG